LHTINTGLDLSRDRICSTNFEPGAMHNCP
jgi:hypothetical protein